MADALVSHEYNDVTGVVTVNVVDALMAIASAINRLAAAQEATNLRDELFVQRVRDVVSFKTKDDDNGPGHA